MIGKKLFVRAVENWPAKILSVALALLIFVFHRMSTLEERLFFSPLHIEIHSTMMPSSSFPRMVRLSMRGEANSIHPIMEEDIEVYVDLQRFDVPGTYMVPVQWRRTGTALGVDPLQITVDPMEISISVDHRLSRFVPLTVSLRGQVDPGYVMTSHGLYPNQVILDGPAQLMDGITELFTEFVDLDGRQYDFTIPLGILNPNPLTQIRGIPSTEFSASISRIITVRNIPNVPVQLLGLASTLEAQGSPPAVHLRLEGEDHDLVNRFSLSPGFLRLDLGGITEPGSYDLPVLYGSVAGLQIQVEPSYVRVTLSGGEDFF
ncbi:MAG: CdaR family protein [Treponema sp.]|nr:CdaR family protein [Treponema sp.]